MLFKFSYGNFIISIKSEKENVITYIFQQIANRKLFLEDFDIYEYIEYNKDEKYLIPLIWRALNLSGNDIIVYLEEKSIYAIPKELMGNPLTIPYKIGSFL